MFCILCVVCIPCRLEAAAATAKKQKLEEVAAEKAAEKARKVEEQLQGPFPKFSVLQFSHNGVMIIGKLMRYEKAGTSLRAIIFSGGATVRIMVSKLDAAVIIDEQLLEDGNEKGVAELDRQLAAHRRTVARNQESLDKTAPGAKRDALMRKIERLQLQLALCLEQKNEAVIKSKAPVQRQVLASDRTNLDAAVQRIIADAQFVRETYYTAQSVALASIPVDAAAAVVAS